MTKLRNLYKPELQKEGMYWANPKAVKGIVEKTPLKKSTLKKITDYANENPYKVLGAGAATALTGGGFLASQNADKEQVKSFFKNYAIDTSAGGISGAGVALLTQPLDTKTIRTQAGSKVIGKPFSGLGGRLTKTVAAGAIGYPLFTGTQALIKRDREKTAAVAFGANLALRAGKALSKLLGSTTATRATLAAKGATGIGNASFKSKSYLSGMMGSGTAFSLAPKAKTSRMATEFNQQAKLTNMSNKIDKPY